MEQEDNESKGDKEQEVENKHAIKDNTSKHMRVEKERERNEERKVSIIVGEEEKKAKRPEINRSEFGGLLRPREIPRTPMTPREIG